jgi:hypothetical protein
MVFNATFNNISVISWRSVLLVEETGVLGENHWPVASHWQTLSHNVVSSTSPWTWFELITLVVIGTDCTSSCKSNYHTITTTTTPSTDIINSLVFFIETTLYGIFQGRIQRGAVRPPPPPPPLKLKKIWFFWRKIVIFHTKYPKNFRASLRN